MADMDNSTVLMHIKSGNYYNIGEIGGKIWELLKDPLTINELAHKLIKEYDVSFDKCKNDITPFIDKMLSENLLINNNE